MTKLFEHQKDRVQAFCDAVFSIAITLLILEIEIPTYEALSTSSFSAIILNLVPSFVGFLVSFMVIAIYWVSHLRIFKFLKTLSERLVWLNIMLLFFVILLPFSTALYVGDFYGTATFVFYCLNLVLLGLFNYLLIKAVVKKEHGKNGLTHGIAKWLKFRSINAVVIWALAALIAPFLHIS